MWTNVDTIFPEICQSMASDLQTSSRRPKEFQGQRDRPLPSPVPGTLVHAGIPGPMHTAHVSTFPDCSQTEGLRAACPHKTMRRVISSMKSIICCTIIRRLLCSWFLNPIHYVLSPRAYIQNYPDFVVSLEVNLKTCTAGYHCFLLPYLSICLFFMLVFSFPLYFFVIFTLRYRRIK
jgi:hypothetical protein